MADHALIGEPNTILVPEPTPVHSISPVTLPAPNRIVNLQLKVSAPAIGSNLPIILLSHGHGRSNHLSSLNGYAPLANFWAAHGFVVIQPTHLSSKSLSLAATTPGAPLFWRSRAEDMSFILDHLSDIEAQAPFIQGRLDRNRVAVAGHSMGGHTASMLLGATLTDPDSQTGDGIGPGEVVSLLEPRIKAGILLGCPGNGGADLSEFAAKNYSFFLGAKFTEMKTPTLVIAGGEDVSAYLSTRGADWFADPYHLSTGPKILLTLCGGKHGLGGVAGYDVAETDDESLERVAVVQRLSWAYLRSTLYGGDRAWEVATNAFKGLNELGWVESKQ